VTLSNLLLFAGMEVVLCLTPGPAVLLVVSQAMRLGARMSLRGALGILAGNGIYFALSAAGLGAVLLASRLVFETLKWAGAAYLIFLGLRMVFFPAPAATDAPRQRATNPFVQGLVTQLANPKAIIFFSALLPQFVDARGSVALQFLVLGVISTVIEFFVLLFYGIAADRGRAVYARHARVTERLAGGCLAIAGARLAVAR
jgi:homoserine/homoserine lactone efflux protein